MFISGLLVVFLKLSSRMYKLYLSSYFQPSLKTFFFFLLYLFPWSFLNWKEGYVRIIVHEKKVIISNGVTHSKFEHQTLYGALSQVFVFLLFFLFQETLRPQASTSLTK